MNQRSRRQNKLLWDDPDPTTHGLLLSDRIEFYARSVGLIDPLKDHNLRPASYDLTLGKLFYKSGKVQELKSGETLTLPPNDIVFVTTEEKLLIPYYMIGRFNLIIGLVYQGILLGTGPQVDPGYSGPLYCPLYNLSNQEVQIPQGERFATIDFIKTTPFADKQKLVGIASEEDLYKACEDRLISGHEGYRFRLFPAGKKDRELSFRLPKYTISSTLVDLRDKVQRMEDTISRLQLVNYLAIAVVAGVVIALGALVATTIYYNHVWIARLSEKVVELCARVPGCP